MINSLEYSIEEKLKNKGVDFVKFINISNLINKQNKGFPNAILIGIKLSPSYLLKVTNSPNYVEDMKRDKLAGEDEFNLKELKTDHLADCIADYLISIGYTAYSQSENNVYETGFYNETNKSTPLPHKTIAGLAGLGWIGKHNLLVTSDYGSAISMCTVLTDAPLKTILNSFTISECGDCIICESICQVKAIKGNSWNVNLSRDEIVDIKRCNTCLKCMVLCPFTQSYMKRNIEV